MPYIFWRDALAKNKAKPETHSGNPDYPNNAQTSHFKFKITSQTKETTITEKRTGDTTPQISTDKPPGPQNGVDDDNQPRQQDTDTTVEQDLYWPRSEEKVGKLVIHNDLTLDQYYYESLPDTNGRDCDQALGRLFEDEQTSSANKGHRSSQPERREAAKDKRNPQILTVNQLWLWILDDGMSYLSFYPADIIS